MAGGGTQLVDCDLLSPVTSCTARNMEVTATINTTVSHTMDCDQFANHTATTLRLHCDRIATTLRPHCDHITTTLRPLCDHIATTLRPLTDHFATILQLHCD